MKLYQPLFGSSLKNVEITIDQPRINLYDTGGCSVEDLLAWGEEIKPKAMMAYMGFGEYHAGSWCQFCRANGICKAQAAQQIGAFDDFKDAVESRNVALLSPDGMSDVLARGKDLVAWYEAVKKRALEAMLNGEKIPGWKVVAGRSSRVWSNQDKALDTLIENGIDRAVIYDSVPKTLAQLEKVLGKKKFEELVGEFVVKPQGSPTLADENDSRKEFSSAAADFAEVADNGSK